ncbi:MAG: helix-turn-helix domain-containing protein [Candidatus Levybacteria bacterium]|nr:helix-turn-helix domain-containing protein [Candidatus Levybacteria bacterium]
MLKAGERLREERLARGITLEEAERATKIRSSFLSQIEKSEYSKLPSAAYAQGFVRNYADFLGLEDVEILALFRREFDENKVYKVLPQGLAADDFPLKKFKIKQTVFFGSLIFSALFLYIFFQYRSAFLGPTLDISSPKDNAIVSTASVNVTGKTTPDSTVYVNDEAVTVGNNGSFKKDISLFPGDNKITIRSLNRFGRETVIERNVKSQ